MVLRAGDIKFMALCLWWASGNRTNRGKRRGDNSHSGTDCSCQKPDPERAGKKWGCKMAEVCTHRQTLRRWRGLGCRIPCFQHLLHHTVEQSRVNWKVSLFQPFKQARLDSSLCQSLPEKSSTTTVSLVSHAEPASMALSGQLMPSHIPKS